LTKKQKEEKAMAEIRKQALLSSGVQIEGLQQTSGNGASGSKKVVYGSRKKKGPIAKEVLPTPESGPRSPSPAPSPVPPLIQQIEKEETPATDDGPKDDWDVSSDDEKSKAPVTETVKDSWDASSGEEDNKSPSLPTPAQKSVLASAKSNQEGMSVLNPRYLNKLTPNR
jgi:translation initiation factor 5B